MSISELTNSPITTKLADKEIKISRLALGEFMSLAEVEVKNAIKANINDVSKFLSGKEKIDFLTASTKEIPSGADLYEKTISYLNSVNGMTLLLKVGLNKHQKFTEAEIIEMVTTDPESVESIVAYLMGVDGKKEEVTEANTDSNQNDDKKK